MTRLFLAPRAWRGSHPRLAAGLAVLEIASLLAMALTVALEVALAAWLAAGLAVMDGLISMSIRVGLVAFAGLFGIWAVEIVLALRSARRARA